MGESLLWSLSCVQGIQVHPALLLHGFRPYAPVAKEGVAAAPDLNKPSLGVDVLMAVDCAYTEAPSLRVVLIIS